MKRTTSYRIVLIAFYLTVAASALFLVPATLNYLQFYVALSHMYLKINSFDIYPVHVGQLRDAVVSADFSIVQNSSYVGLSVLSVDVIAYYDKGAGYSQILFSRKFTVGDSILGPHSSLHCITANDTYLQYFQLFADYNNQSMAKGEPVELLFTSDINLFMLGNPLANTVNLDDVTYQMPYYVS
jgi:hypothetical protein